MPADEPRIMVPTFEVASNPQMRLSDIRSRAFRRDVPDWVIPNGDPPFDLIEGQSEDEQRLIEVMSQELTREMDREILNSIALSQSVLTGEQRESIIANALESDEGRQALAQAMVEPIRRSLEYQSIGRQLMGVQELPAGALANYNTSVTEDIASDSLDDVFVAHPPLTNRSFDNLLIED